MSLLKKIDTGFEFIKILEDGYEINEEPDTMAILKYANGKRKRITRNHEDIVIKVELGGLDATDAKRYIDNLTDGPYEYWSVVHQQYKRANFLVSKDPISINKFYSNSNYFLNDIKIVLEKSSDIA